MKKIGTVAEFPKQLDILSTFQSFMSEVDASEQTSRAECCDAATLLRTFVFGEYFPKLPDSVRIFRLRSLFAAASGLVPVHRGPITCPVLVSDGEVGACPACS
jgi:hypothetical protein